MSKLSPFFSTALAFAVSILFVGGSHAQQHSVVLEIRSGEKPSVKVALDSPSRRHLSFAISSAVAMPVTARVGNLRLSGSAGGPEVPFRELQPGEYLADKDFGHVSYDLDLSPLKDRSGAAHSSWIQGDTGILRLRDVLPLHAGKAVRISFTGETQVRSIYARVDERVVALTDAEDAVFYVGNGWRVLAANRCADCPVLFIAGSWQFTDQEATTFISDIVESYDDLFGSQINFSRVAIALVKYPARTEAGSWDAETVGRNVTIVSSDMPFKTQSLQRLHEQLRHEIFHLWIPNGVNLTGSYDWFYEGFALYESLKLALRQNRIRFEDFLDTLSRAHTIDSAYTQRPSLIVASRNRFGGNNTQVYARGMLVAFLTDVILIEKSKSSVEELLRRILRSYPKSGSEVEGNEAVLALMDGNPDLRPIVKRYIRGSETMLWESELAAAGIEDSDPGPVTRLQVRAKLSGRQKTVLDKLGYNSWRTLSPRSK